MSEAITAQQLAEYQADKQKTTAKKGRGAAMFFGFVAGCGVTYILMSLIFAPVVQQRDACQARFTRGTMLWDMSGGSEATVPLFHGLINVSPGKALVPDQPRPAWFIPADVTPVFYGDINSAQVLKLSHEGQIVSRGTPLSLAQVQANPNLMVVSQ
jgi:hypothetical protein